MQLSKPVTSSKPLTCADFLCSEVTEVTAEVTKKPIYRDIIYNIVTSVTSNIVSRVNEKKKYKGHCSFWGNQHILREKPKSRDTKNGYLRRGNFRGNRTDVSIIRNGIVVTWGVAS